MEKVGKYTDELRQDKRQRGLSTWAVGRVAHIFGEILLRLASLTLGIIVDRWAKRARPPNIYLLHRRTWEGDRGAQEVMSSLRQMDGWQAMSSTSGLSVFDCTYMFCGQCG